MNHLAIQLHNQVYRLRKVIIFLLISLGASAVFAKKTTWNYGMETELNFSNQLSYNPRNIQNETHNWKAMRSLGCAAFIEYKEKQHFSVLSKLGYNQKGFIQNAASSAKYIPVMLQESTQLTTTKNKFHYISIEGLAKYSFGRKMIQPYVDAGIALNVLLAKNACSSEIFQQVGTSLYDYKNYSSVAAGVLAGAGLIFDKKIGLEFETNLDLTKSVNTLNLSVKNWVNSIKLSFYINELIK